MQVASGGIHAPILSTWIAGLCAAGVVETRQV
jgi:hypothetical protein